MARDYRIVDKSAFDSFISTAELAKAGSRPEIESAMADLQEKWQESNPEANPENSPQFAVVEYVGSGGVQVERKTTVNFSSNRSGGRPPLTDEQKAERAAKRAAKAAEKGESPAPSKKSKR